MLKKIKYQINKSEKERKIKQDMASFIDEDNIDDIIYTHNKLSESEILGSYHGDFNRYINQFKICNLYRNYV